MLAKIYVSKSTGLALQLEGNLPFLLYFTLYLRAAVSKYKPLGGAYIWRSDLMEGFLRYEFGGPLFEGALWRGLFSEFYGIIFQISSFSRLFNVACNMYY